MPDAGDSIQKPCGPKFSDLSSKNLKNQGFRVSDFPPFEGGRTLDVPTVPSLATLVLGTLSPWPPPPPNCWPWSEPAFGAATATGLRSLCFYTENLPTWPENQSPT